MVDMNYNYTSYISSLKSDIKKCYLIGYKEEQVYKSLNNVFKEIFNIIFILPFCMQFILMIIGIMVGNVNYIIFIFILLIECLIFILLYKLFLGKIKICTKEVGI